MGQAQKNGRSQKQPEKMPWRTRVSEGGEVRVMMEGWG